MDEIEKRAIQAAKVMGLVKGDEVAIAGVTFVVRVVEKKTGVVRVIRKAGSL